MDYAIHLAEQLHFLHSMSPPIIHRDIKPQNVIVDEAGHCHFIDIPKGLDTIPNLEFFDCTSEFPESS